MSIGLACPKSRTSVIPAKAGIHPRNGAPSQPRRQSNTPPIRIRRWILACWAWAGRVGIFASLRTHGQIIVNGESKLSGEFIHGGPLEEDHVADVHHTLVENPRAVVEVRFGAILFVAKHRQAFEMP